MLISKNFSIRKVSWVWGEFLIRESRSVQNSEAWLMWHVLGMNKLRFQSCCAHCQAEYFILGTSNRRSWLCFISCRTLLVGVVWSAFLQTVFKWQVSTSVCGAALLWGGMRQDLPNLTWPAAASSAVCCADATALFLV